MKLENYLVTATELNEMAVTFGYATKNIINNSIKAVTKSEANTAFFLDQASSPYSTYTSNRCPRYQDFKCPDPGVNLTLTVTPHSDAGGCNILSSDYVFELTAGSGPSSATSTIAFDVTLPIGLTYGVFKYIHYNGQSLNPTAPYYIVTNEDPQYFRVILNKQIGNNDDYSISFTVNRNELYGQRQVVTNLTSTFCVTTTTTPKTFTYTDEAPQISAVLSAPNSLVDCGPVIQYSLNLTNTGAPVCGTVFEFTAPTDIKIESLEYNVNYNFEDWWCFWCSQYNECESCGTVSPANLFFWNTYPAVGWYSPVQVLYNNVLVNPTIPSEHTQWFDVLEFNQTTGKVKIRFNKVLDANNSYKLYFYGHWIMPTGVTTTTINSVGSITYKTTSSNGTSTISTNTVTSELTRIYPTDYYELIGCSASDYAFTLIQPLGVNNRYVHSQTGAVYLATGNVRSQCTPPSLLNESIQRTTFYNCEDAPPPPPPPPIENINFTVSYTCTSNGINNITISNITGGTGAYEIINDPKTSEYNASSGTFISLTGSSYTYYNNQNGTWFLAVRDAALHTRLTIKNTGNIYCCPNTNPDWQNNGSTNCYNTCNEYHIEQDYNACSETVGQTRQGALYATNSIACGGCCGQGPCCGQSTVQTSTIDPIGVSYSCSNGNVNSTSVYGNTNSCYTGPDIYLINGAWTSNNPINTYPSTASACYDTGSAYCQGPNWVISQYQGNSCSSAACGTRVLEYNSVTHGCYDPCTGNTAPIYTSQGYNTCYNCSNVEVFKDTNTCSNTNGGYYVAYAGYTYVGNQPSGTSCNYASSCQDTGNAYCSGPNWVINQSQANPCSNTSCGVRVIEYNSVSNGCYSPPACIAWRMENYNGYGQTDYIEWTDCDNHLNSTWLSDGSFIDICFKDGTSVTYSYSTPSNMGTC